MSIEDSRVITKIQREGETLDSSKPSGNTAPSMANTPDLLPKKKDAVLQQPGDDVHLAAAGVYHRHPHRRCLVRLVGVPGERMRIFRGIRIGVRER